MQSCSMTLGLSSHPSCPAACAKFALAPRTACRARKLTGIQTTADMRLRFDTRSYSPSVRHQLTRASGSTPADAGLRFDPS